MCVAMTNTFEQYIYIISAGNLCVLIVLKVTFVEQFQNTRSSSKFNALQSMSCFDSPLVIKQIWIISIHLVHTRPPQFFFSYDTDYKFSSMIPKTWPNK